MRWVLAAVVALAILIAVLAIAQRPGYVLNRVYLPSSAVIVMRERAGDRVRLTSRDLTNQGVELATRTFDGTTHGWCKELPPDRLVCEVDEGDVRVLDARTLADRADITRMIERALPTSEIWYLDDGFGIHPDGTFDVPIERNVDARIDLVKGTVTKVPVTSRDGRDHHADRCRDRHGETDHRGVRWKIEGGKLVRARVVAGVVPAEAEAEIEPIAEPIANGWVLACGSFSAGVLVRSLHGAGSQLARLDEAGRPRWIAELGADPEFVFVVGDRVVVATERGERRLISIDLATGTLQWVAPD